MLRLPTYSVLVQLLARGRICSRYKSVGNCISVRQLVSSTNNEQYYTLPVLFKTRTPGEKMTVDVGIWDVRPSDPTLQTPLVVAIHGQPGSSQDFESLARRLAGHDVRVVALDFPGNGRSRLFGKDIYRLDHSTEGKYQMLTTILEALAIDRVDVLMGHSAGTWLSYKAAADLPLAKSSVILNPLSKRHHRTLRPYMGVKILAALLRNPSLHLTIYKTLPFLYKMLGFVLDEDAFPSLPIAVESMRQVNFDKMQAFAEAAGKKKHPFVMAITRNDKIGEWNFAMEMAHHLGIEEGEITKIGKDSITIADTVGKYDDSYYRRVLLFERGGHVVHKAHEQEIVIQILKLLKVVCSHHS